MDLVGQSNLIDSRARASLFLSGRGGMEGRPRDGVPMYCIFCIDADGGVLERPIHFSNQVFCGLPCCLAWIDMCFAPDDPPCWQADGSRCTHWAYARRAASQQYGNADGTVPPPARIARNERGEPVRVDGRRTGRGDLREALAGACPIWAAGSGGAVADTAPGGGKRRRR